ncbi:hypothetical protein BABINDRAFT_163587 [Babjeviella inositovora NRRL Y-12698]|uniref:Septation initiation network scaffold protein cdc11 n=1 Tax=Babjeviella inositovora NRRL Y-12698 TaxID=984486 RepID=A0A1E3QI97_9ASCO|nr:uncharacterized protein BABINDRAFT_163587 [Babjeviella inositovora NRRL Y-12698]ODQ77328.1 hypothetical protein BABINDRAFT_163587 [Babjeviella inositovora NRRL Y-12698]
MSHPESIAEEPEHRKVSVRNDSLNLNIQSYMDKINIGDSMRNMSHSRPETSRTDEDTEGTALSEPAKRSHHSLSGRFEDIAEEEPGDGSFYISHSSNIAAQPQSTLPFSLNPQELHSLTSQFSEWTLSSEESVQRQGPDREHRGLRSSDIENHGPSDHEIREGDDDPSDTHASGGPSADNSPLSKQNTSDNALLHEKNPSFVPGTPFSHQLMNPKREPTKPYVENEYFDSPSNVLRDTRNLETTPLVHSPEAGKENGTPSWMPPALRDEWIPQETAQLSGSNAASTKNPVDSAGTNLGTVVHASDKVETPNWKRLANQLEEQKRNQPVPLLKLIFLPIDSSKSEKASQPPPSHCDPQNSYDTQSNHDPQNSYDTQSSHDIQSSHDTQSNRRETTPPSNEVADSTPRQASPLKLFGNKYNTFTKDKLSNLLDNLRLDPSAISKNDREALALVLDQHQEELEEEAAPSTASHLSLRGVDSTEMIFQKDAADMFERLKLGYIAPEVTTAHTMGSGGESAKYPEPRHGLTSRPSYDIGIASVSQTYTQNHHLDSVRQKGSNSSSLRQVPELDEYGTSLTFSDMQSGKDGEPNSSRTISYMRNDFVNGDAEFNGSEYTSDGDFEIAQSTGLGSSMVEEQPSLSLPMRYSSVIHSKPATLGDYPYERKSSAGFIIEEESEGEEDESDAYSETGNLTGDVSRIQTPHIKRPYLFPDADPPSQTRTQLKGFIPQDTALPQTYNDMVYDVRDKKWSRKRGQATASEDEQMSGSLDHLSTIHNGYQPESDAVNPSTPEKVKTPNKRGLLRDDIHGSILKTERHLRTRNSNSELNMSKMEVSFAVPHDSSLDAESLLSPPRKTAPRSGSLLDYSSAKITKVGNVSSAANITQVSQLNDVTFSQTRKNLVHTITECLSHIPNFEALDWDTLREIDMSGHELDSLKDLSKFLPLLQHISVSRNAIKFFKGIPRGVLTIVARENAIENISSFHEFHDLQALDLSSNKLSRLNNIQHLIHLRELTVTGNRLDSIDGLQNLSNLARLNLSNNNLSGTIDFTGYHLHTLQEVSLAENSITEIRGIRDLPELRILNLDENLLAEFGIDLESSCAQLKKLLVKFNKIRVLNLEVIPAIRVLRIDGNSIRSLGENFRTLSHVKLHYIEEISAKCQSPAVLQSLLLYKDVSKLDLSGNITNYSTGQTSSTIGLFDMGKLPRDCYLNVTTLNLSAMNLTRLPHIFSTQFPNVRELNLNYNQLSDLLPLAGCKRLARLCLVSNDLTYCEPLVKALSGSRKTLRVLDLRLNPINGGYYPYVFNPREDESRVDETIQNYRARSGDKRHSRTSKSPGTPLITLNTVDDIESFSILYDTMMKPDGRRDWNERDLEYSRVLRSKDYATWSKRQAYETLFVNLLKGMQDFDAIRVDRGKRKDLEAQFRRRSR